MSDLLEPGTKVKAGDRDNRGEIVEDHGPTALVHFVSPERSEKTVELDKKLLTVISPPRRGRKREDSKRSKATANGGPGSGGTGSTSFTPKLAWIIRRALTGIALNGELESVTGEWQSLVGHMASLPLDARQDALDAFLCDRHDRDAIVNALAEADPMGVPPAPEVATDDPSPTIKLTRASDVECRPVEWLCDSRIPLGMLTMFAGDPKIGKSLVTIGLAAAVSRGLPWVDRNGDTGTAGGVVILSAEDDTSRTIVPRLKAAGADLERVQILEAVYLKDGNEALPSLQEDLELIEEAIRRTEGCRLVIIDPVSAYLGDVDDHRNADLRGVLSPLKLLAERLNVAIVLVNHLNKASGSGVKYRVNGSIAYVAVCRANYLFALDPDFPDGSRGLMLSNGVNIGPEPVTLAYRIRTTGEGATVEWESEPVAMTAEEALHPRKPISDQEETDRKDLDDWLLELLQGGRVEAAEIEKMGTKAGFSKTALKRAKSRIGAISGRDGFGPGAVWYWRLADSETDPRPTSADVPVIETKSP